MRLAGAVAVLVFMLAGVAFAGHGGRDGLCDRFPTDPRCVHDTTTTTQATTTTTEPELVIPPTQPYPRGLKDNDGFNFIISCSDTPTVTCDLNSAGKGKITEFAYLGHGMPYLYSEAVEGNHDHGWWEDGDREGYRCAYGFLYDKKPEPFGELLHPDGHFIARATIVRGGGYSVITDRYMAEGQRYYDGTVATQNGSEIVDEDCLETALDDFDYDAYIPQGPDDIRVGLFRADGEIADIRDFTDIELLVPAHFEFLGFENGRVTIVLILGATNKASHVFYYDVMNDGRIVVEVNGQLIGG